VQHFWPLEIEQSALHLKRAILTKKRPLRALALFEKSTETGGVKMLTHLAEAGRKKRGRSTFKVVFKNKRRYVG
jgi:hypothetical protein